MKKQIIKIIDSENPRDIASHINNGEFTYTELNDALVDSVIGVTDKDLDAISLFFKRECKVEETQQYLAF